MKTKLLLITMLICLGFTTNAQTLGTKKVIVMKFGSYGCGDDVCELEFTDENTGKSYIIFDMIDKKSILNGTTSKIQELYYKNGNTDTDSKGKFYQVILEYRKTDELKFINPDEAPKKQAERFLNG